MYQCQYNNALLLYVFVERVLLYIQQVLLESQAATQSGTPKSTIETPEQCLKSVLS